MTIHVRFQQTFPLRVSEWFGAGAMATWGMIVLTHPGMFDGNVFQGLAGLAPQRLWGWAATISGLIGWTALAINGALRRTPHVRALCAMLRSAIWLQITVGMMLSGQVTTGLAMYPWALALDTYNIFRAAADAGQSDQSAKARG